MKALYRLLLLAGVALVVDGLTKTWAERALTLYEPVPVLGEFFRLTLGYNTGVVFGLFANSGLSPLILTGLIIVGFAAWLLAALRTSTLPAVTWPLGLILGGAIANFLDRLPDGRVTDFLDVGLGAARWPTFNLADSSIVLGVVLLLLIPQWERHPQASTRDLASRGDG